MIAALLRFAITAAALPVCAHYMDGVVLISQQNAIVVGVILAVIYTLLRRLLRLLLAVINFFTLGLLYVAADAAIVWTAASYVENSVRFDSFLWAVAVAVAINAARTLVDIVTGDTHR